MLETHTYTVTGTAELGVWACVPNPGAPLTNFNDRGVQQRFIFYIFKKITTSEFIYPKKSLLFLAYPKKSLSPFFATQKNPSVFFLQPKKISASFIDPKNHFWPKFQTPKNHSDPPPSHHKNM